MTSTPQAPTDIDAVREDIEQTREKLAHTVEALTAKADVKTRMQTSVRNDPLPWLSGAVALIGALILVGTRRR
jgi:hypothetical protein